MNNEAEKPNDESPRHGYLRLAWGLVIALVAYNLYLGVTVRKLGIPGIFEIEFGGRPPANPAGASTSDLAGVSATEAPPFSEPLPAERRFNTEFEVRQLKWYKHPKREYQLFLDKFRLSLSGYAGDNFDVRTMPQNRWVQLANQESGERLPAIIRKDMERIYAQWLP